MHSAPPLSPGLRVGFQASLCPSPTSPRLPGACVDHTLCWAPWGAARRPGAVSPDAHGRESEDHRGVGRVAQPQVDGREGHVQTVSCPLVAITKNHGLGSLEQKWISLFEGSREGPSCASLLGGSQQTCVSLGLFTCHLPKLCPHGHIALSSVPSPFSSLTMKTPVRFRARPDPRRLIISAKTPLAT